MDRFIGRSEELQTLNKCYSNNGFQMIIIYGRRRIGKSTLIKEFIKGKKAVYFAAIKGSFERNIERFGMQIKESLEPDRPGLNLRTFDEIVEYLDFKSKERIAIVIDELPYMAEGEKSFLSMLQNAIDERWSNGQMMLILCGSSVSFMIDEVMSEKSPLYGRRTSQMKIDAFNYEESAEFVPKFSYEEKAIVYGITGGVAKYLSLMDDSLTLDENIINQFFSKAGYLYEEPENLLQQEYRNIVLYSEIIRELAAGTNRVNDIADKIHEDPSSVSHALPNLLKTGIVSKDMAITDESNKKKVQYNLADSMFRFWYRFVPNGINAIEMGQGKAYYEHVVKAKLHDYMGEVFEKMCRYYTLKRGLSFELSCYVTKVGKWWGSNPDKKEQTDIDVVGLDLENKKAVLGECKFKNAETDKDVLEALLERNGLIDHKYQTVQFLLFSLSGFSKWVIENAEKQNVKLVKLDEMYQ